MSLLHNVSVAEFIWVLIKFQKIFNMLINESSGRKVISLTHTQDLLFFLKNIYLGYVFWFFTFTLNIVHFISHLNSTLLGSSSKISRKWKKKNGFSDSLDSLLYFLSFKYKVVHYRQAKCFEFISHLWKSKHANIPVLSEMQLNLSYVTEEQRQLN